MLFKPLLGTDLSGKIGGIVASHNSGGAYFRAASIPTNPNTPQQQAVRTAVANLTAIWSTGLTQPQRDAWQVYADNVTLMNRVGEQINVSGLAMYVRSNVPKLQTGLPRQDTAPSAFNLGAFTGGLPSNATVAGQTVDIQFGTSIVGDPWANEAGSWLLVYISRPQNAGVVFFKGPYRVQGSLQGDPVPPVSPFTTGVPFAFTLGQRLFTRTIVTYLDGRLTLDVRGTTVAVA